MSFLCKIYLLNETINMERDNCHNVPGGYRDVRQQKILKNIQRSRHQFLFRKKSEKPFKFAKTGL